MTFNHDLNTLSSICANDMFLVITQCSYLKNTAGSEYMYRKKKSFQMDYKLAHKIALCNDYNFLLVLISVL